MSLLLLHQAATFKDAAIDLRGNAHLKCKFIRCNIHVRDGELMLNECESSACVWHLDTVIASKDEFEGLTTILALIEKSVIIDGTDAADVGIAPVEAPM